jgi:hypothetical protein
MIFRVLDNQIKEISFMDFVDAYDLLVLLSNKVLLKLLHTSIRTY